MTTRRSTSDGDRSQVEVGDASPEGVTHYPSDLACDVSGSDGQTVQIRPILPSDGPRLRALHERLSTRSRYLRFFNAHPYLADDEVDRFTHVDYDARLALVVQRASELVAVGRYEQLPGTTEAEVAFVVADELQHRGLGTLLLDRLAAAAWERGITAFVATTLAENQTMLDVFRHSGYRVRFARDGDSIDLRFSIRPDRDSRAAVARRVGLGALATNLVVRPC